MEESATIRKAQRGDEAAFCRIVYAYQSRLRGYLATRTKTPADADDLAQDTFVVAYRKIAERW